MIADKKKIGKQNRAAGARFELNKYSLANKKRWANPEYKKKVSASISKAMLGKKSRLGSIQSEETKEKIRNSPYHKNFGRKGAKNYNWKGDDVKYGSLHTWIKNNFLAFDMCDLCGTRLKTLEWSNKDHKYSRKREDWQFVCRSCHRRYDNDNKKRKK